MVRDYLFTNSSTWIETSSFDWQPYRQNGIEVPVPKNHHLFHEGDPISYVFVVMSGRIRLCQMSLTGEEKAIVVVGANGLVGEVSAMNSTHYITSAVTASECLLLRLSEDQFHCLFRTDLNFAEFVCRYISHKFMLLSHQVTALSYASAQYRIVQHLLELGETYGDLCQQGVRIRIHFTQQEMANLVGTTRITVTQVFRRLERIGLLKKDGDNVHIPSLEALRHLLSDPKASHYKNKQISKLAR